MFSDSQRCARKLAGRNPLERGQVLLEMLLMAVFLCIFLGAMISVTGKTQQRMDGTNWSHKSESK